MVDGRYIDKSTIKQKFILPPFKNLKPPYIVALVENFVSPFIIVMVIVVNIDLCT